MLIKTELVKIPIYMECLNRMTGKGYYVSARIKQLPKLGRILSVFVFNLKDKTLALRWFTDGKNFITYDEIAKVFLVS